MEFENSVLKFFRPIHCEQNKKKRNEIGCQMTKPDFKGDWNFS